MPEALLAPELLPWHSLHWEQFLSRVHKKTVPHALLLTGPSGLGQWQFALYLSQYLLCTERHDSACKDCSACHLFRGQTHPDFHLLIPEEAGKAIKVDAVRSLNQALVQSAQQGLYKVAIISPASVMNRAASNALLKTLEEPSKNTMLILITENDQLLLPTIRSRCQVINFATPAREQSLQWLDHQKANDMNQAWLALEEGAPLNVLRWHEDSQLNQAYDEFQLAILSYHRDFVSVACANSLATLAQQLGAEKIMQWLRQFFQDCLRVQEVNRSVRLAHVTMTSQITDIVNHYQNTDWFEIEQRVLKTQKLIRQQANINLQLALDNLLISIQSCYGREQK